MRVFLIYCFLYSAHLSLGQSASDFYKRAVARYNQGDFAGAITEYSRAIDIRPNSAVLWNNRGVCKYKLLRYSEAIKDYGVALDLDKDYIHAYFNKGNCHLDLAEYDKALVSYDEVVKRDEKYKNVYKNRAKVFFYLQDYRSCLVDIDRGLSRSSDPEDHKKLYFFKAEASVKLNKLDEAMSYYTKVLEIDPEHFVSYLHRGQVKLKLKLHEEAIKDFTLAMRFDNTGEAYYYRGLTYIDMVGTFKAEKKSKRNMKTIKESQRLQQLACSDLEKAKSYKYPKSYAAIKDYCE